MRDVFAFAIGALAAFLSWLFPPFHKVDFYILDMAFIVILGRLV